MKICPSASRATLVLRCTMACVLVAFGAAHAVSLNPRGLGEVLIYPYYTVNKNQDTLVTIGNSSDVGKVVNVVAREGMNGRPVLLFRLFLSAHDIWTARISESGGSAGGASLFTADSSCTFAAPPEADGGLAFGPEGYAGGASLPPDGGPADIGRTREGMLEFVEVGTIIPGSALDLATSHAPSSEPNAGTPACTPDVLGSDGFGGGFDVPTGGLHGSAAIVNVGEGTFFAYAADALQDFSDVAIYGPASADFHLTLLAVANSAESASGGAMAHIPDGEGHLQSVDYANGIDAVSAVFMADSLLNEYLVSPSLGANTDWIVAFPTRMFYVDAYFVGPGAARPPFARIAAAARSDVAAYARLFDQEEGPCVECQPMPVPPVGVVLAWQVNALTFRSPGSSDAPSEVLGSRLAISVEPWAEAGWMELDLAIGDGGHALSASTDGTILHGLPATGFMVYNIINANAAPGRLANYGGAFTHRAVTGG